MDLKMEVYTPGLSLVGLLEIQRSVIWEEKAFSAGSFSVESLITKESRTLLVPENIIWIEGETAGIIEHIDQQVDENGPYISVKGRNLTGILDRRILWGQYDLSGTVPDIMRRLVDDCCINPTRGEDPDGRIIPGLFLAQQEASDQGESILVQKTGGTLLEALEELGEAYGVAFGVRFDPMVPRMEFWARRGVARSVNQNTNEPVFYSTELDDVLSSEYSYDSNDFRNVALVAGEGDGKDRVSVTVSREASEPPTPPEPVKYTVTLSVDPEGGGTASGGNTVTEGTSITVSAVAASGFEFTGWREDGNIVSTNTSYTFTVTGDRALTAVFAVVIPVYVVTVTAEPSSGGTVSGGGAYEQGQSVTLTQVTADGYRFAGWYNADGTLLSTAETYTFTPTGSVSITAKYAVIPIYTITASIDPDGSGAVSGAGSYREGQTVSVTAAPADGYQFSAWRENGETVSEEESYTFVASGDRTLVAEFAVEKPTHNLPQGYTELEYIESTGTQYVISGVKPTSAIRLTLDVEPMVAAITAQKSFFGSSYIPSSSGTRYFFVAGWKSDGIVLTTGSTTTFATYKTLNADTTLRRMTIEVDCLNRKAFVDEGPEVALTNVNTSTSMSEIRLLADGGGTTILAARLYACQIELGNVLTRDFVPCISPSNVVGLFDIVNEKFYSANGKGTFTPGPAL